MDRVSMLEHRVMMLERQLRTAMALARSTLAPDDSGAVQKIQTRLDPLSLADGIPIMQNYGFASSLPVGGDKAVMFFNGDRSQGVVVASNHQLYRLRGLAEGEAAVYDKWAHYIRLGANGITIAGNVSITGTLGASGNVTAGAGTPGPVDLLGHRHGTGNAAAGTLPPTPGT